VAKYATTNQHISVDTKEERDALWHRHNAAWRSTAQVASQWQDASDIDPKLLKYKVTGSFWDIVEANNVTLLVSREYEHLLVALSVYNSTPSITFMPMPHPSGIVVDRVNDTVYVASTRNPNQIYDLTPVDRMTKRLDVRLTEPLDQPLVPVRSRFLPGCMYMHDLALIGSKLYANAVGHNAVILLQNDGSYERVWWPKCIETADGPAFGQNYIQLNSIAAGATIEESFYSASSAKISSRRPGHRNYLVDKRGVIFSGLTREPIASGLTRPHSARLHNSTIWVDNSGYGELGLIDRGNFQVVTKLPGWTRGLTFINDVAFVATSCVIPRFRHYAPGLEVKESICGLHAVDIKSGKLLGSICWPFGNQIFAIDWIHRSKTAGFPFAISRNRDQRSLFYAFSTSQHNSGNDCRERS
jgi:uncharacterized protein (TIGR03032 family)